MNTINPTVRKYHLVRCGKNNIVLPTKGREIKAGTIFPILEEKLPLVINQGCTLLTEKSMSIKEILEMFQKK